MSYFRLISIATFCSAFCLSWSQVSPPKLSYFQSYYSKSDAVILKRDLPALLDLLKRSHTKDFKHTPMSTGKPALAATNLPEMLEGVKAVFRMVETFAQSKTTASDYRIIGKNIQLTVNSKLSGHTRPGADHLSHLVTITSRNLVMWIPERGNWKVQKTVTITDALEVDGKFVNPRG